ncbi:MAG: ATP-binding protein [Pseudomonadota bacterium]
MASDWQSVKGTAVAIAGRGLLITGPSGCGKSGLALRLIALGAELIADDQVEVQARDAHVVARWPSAAPKATKGWIEARGFGLLKVPTSDQAVLTALVDLSFEESERLPPLRHSEFMGHDLRLFLGSQHAHFPAALTLYLKGHEDIDPEKDVFKAARPTPPPETGS